MEPIIVVAIIFIFLFVLIYQNRDNQALITSVTESDRGNPSERNLVLNLRKLDFHPNAIFHDLYLQKRDGSYAQIDLVLATTAGLIVFEVKDYSGWIFGSGNVTYWTQVLAYGKKKYRLYNPIIQNDRHIAELRKCSNQLSQIPIFSVVLFYGDSELKKINNIPNDVFVIKPYELKNTITGIITNHPRANYTNKREIVEILRQSTFNGGNYEVQQSHIEYVETVKEQVGAKEGRIAHEWGFNVFPRSVRKPLRWLRNLR